MKHNKSIEPIWNDNFAQHDPANYDRDALPPASATLLGQAEDTDLYLVWSKRMGAWIAPGGLGTTSGLALAGQFTLAEALAIATRHNPDAPDCIALTDLPVRLADINIIREIHRAQYLKQRRRA